MEREMMGWEGKKREGEEKEGEERGGEGREETGREEEREGKGILVNM